MKNILSITAILLLFASCTNRDSVAEFEQYHADASNELSRNVGDCDYFISHVTTSLGNGKFNVNLLYVDTRRYEAHANGIFKYNGKFISFTKSN